MTRTFKELRSWSQRTIKPILRSKIYRVQLTPTTVNSVNSNTLTGKKHFYLFHLEQKHVH